MNGGLWGSVCRGTKQAQKEVGTFLLGPWASPLGPPTRLQDCTQMSPRGQPSLDTLDGLPLVSGRQGPRDPRRRRLPVHVTQQPGQPRPLAAPSSYPQGFAVVFATGHLLLAFVTCRVPAPSSCEPQTSHRKLFLDHFSSDKGPAY